MSAIHNGLLIIGLALAVALPLLERLGGLRLDCALCGFASSDTR